MERKIFFTSLTLGIVLGLVLPVRAFIERLTPLGDLLEDSDCIFIARTQTVSGEKKEAVFVVEEDLKGKSPSRTFRVHLTGDKENHVPHLLKRLAPNVRVVFFLTTVDKQWLGLGYTNGTWFQIIGKPASAAVHWHFTHCEIYLTRTFKGSTDELISTIREVLAGKRKPPPPNPKERPGFGPELPQDKATGLGVSRGRQLMAVILLPPLAGLLGPLVALLFPGVLLAVWRQYRIVVYVLLAQSTLLLVQTGLRWWEPSSWWLAPRYWWWPTLATYGLGLIIVGFARTRQDASLFGKPVALEWLALVSLFGLGVIWAGVAWRWYGTAWDQMTPITLGSAAGLLHLVARRVVHESSWFSQWKTGTVMLASMLLVAAWLAQQDWRSESLPTTNAQANTPTAESWPTYRGNVYRTGCVDASQVPRNPKVLWSCETRLSRGRFYVHGTPTVSDGLVFFGVLHDIQGQTRGYVYCVAVQQQVVNDQTIAPGTVLWRFDAEGTLKPVYCSPTVKEGRLYFGEGYHQDQHCRVFCLDARSGQLLWQYQTRSHVEATPTLSEGLIVTGAGDDGLLALQDSGDRANLSWQVKDWHVDGSPLVVEDVVYAGSLVGDLLTTRTPFVAAFRLRDGRTLWRIEALLPVAGSLAWADGKILVPLGNGKVNADEPVPLGGVMCLEASSGRRVWLYEKCGPVFATPCVHRGRAYFGSKDGRLRCLDVETGRLVWERELDAAIISSPAVSDAVGVAVSLKGTVYAWDTETGEVIWRLYNTLAETQEVYSSPVIRRGRIYVGMGSKLICIGDASEP